MKTPRRRRAAAPPREVEVEDGHSFPACGTSTSADLHNAALTAARNYPDARGALLALYKFANGLLAVLFIVADT